MTAPTRSRSVLIVTDADAAAVLVAPDERRFLESFLGRESSTADAARELGETTERTAYQVRKLVARGLLRAVRSVARKGRDITIYSAPPEVRAPLSVLPEADISHLFDVVDAGGRRAFLSAVARVAARRGVLDWSIRVHRSDDDHVLVDMVSPETEDPRAILSPRAPAVVFHWVPLAVSPDAAKALQRRLASLAEELPVATNAPTHLLGLFMTPLSEDRA